jgi:hypothetical protein
MTNKRGLVISAPVELSNDRVLVKSGGLDPQELRFSLLFWDRLEFPASQAIYIDGGPEVNFLENARILQRTRWPFKGGYLGAEHYREAHIGVFRALDEKEPGVWSMSTGERSLSFLDSDLTSGRGALLQLYHAIPVPDKDVPLQDILEFKENRKAELYALRHHLEAIYQRILTAGDGALAINSEIGALEIAIADQIRVSKEAKLKFRPVSLNASLNLPKGISVGATAWASGLPMVAALLTGAVAAISIGPGTALTWGKATGTPFRYVSAYHQEVF